MPYALLPTLAQIAPDVAPTALPAADGLPGSDAVAPTPWVAFLLVGLPFVLPALGLSSAILLALRRRVSATSEWWLALLLSLPVPYAVVGGAQAAGWIAPSAGGFVLWLGICAAVQLAYAWLWWRRWRADVLHDLARILEEP